MKKILFVIFIISAFLVCNANAGKKKGPPAAPCKVTGQGTSGNPYKIGDGTGTFSIGTLSATGGTIDGAVIGGSTPAAGSFTTIGATGAVTFNGNVTLGNATGDALTFHPGAWTLSNAVTITGTWADIGTINGGDFTGVNLLPKSSIPRPSIIGAFRDIHLDFGEAPSAGTTAIVSTLMSNLLTFDEVGDPASTSPVAMTVVLTRDTYGSYEVPVLQFTLTNPTPLSNYANWKTAVANASYDLDLIASDTGLYYLGVLCNFSHTGIDPVGHDWVAVPHTVIGFKSAGDQDDAVGAGYHYGNDGAVTNAKVLVSKTAATGNTDDTGSAHVDDALELIEVIVYNGSKYVVKKNGVVLGTELSQAAAPGDMAIDAISTWTGGIVANIVVFNGYAAAGTTSATSMSLGIKDIWIQQYNTIPKDFIFPDEPQSLTVSADADLEIKSKVVALTGHTAAADYVLSIQNGTFTGQTITFTTVATLDADSKISIGYTDTTCTSCPDVEFEAVGQSATFYWTGTTWVVTADRSA
jgi:hypothetical protein